MGETRAKSLHLRLWAVIALAVVPMFVMVVSDYRVQRQKAIVGIEHDVERMLAAARQEEELGLQSVQMVLQIMANSDDMRALDPSECSTLARRLLSSLPNFDNIGAVAPDGTMYCSGLAPGGDVNVAERAWFIDATASDGITLAACRTTPCKMPHRPRILRA